MQKSKYRWRTALRGQWPFGVLFGWIPKGKKEDCGHHELYVAEQSPGGATKILRCYHCDYEEQDTTTVAAERQRFERSRQPLRTVR